MPQTLADLHVRIGRLENALERLLHEVEVKVETKVRSVEHGASITGGAACRAIQSVETFFHNVPFWSPKP